MRPKHDFRRLVFGPKHGVRAYVNTYHEELVFGGREEGGWYYDAGTPTNSMAVRGSAANVRRALESAERRCDADNEGRPSYTSVRSQGRCIVRVEAHPGERYPKYRPRYE